MGGRWGLLLVAAASSLGIGPAAAAHGWYTGLVSPQGEACCNDHGARHGPCMAHLYCLPPVLWTRLVLLWYR